MSIEKAYKIEKAPHEGLVRHFVAIWIAYFFLRFSCQASYFNEILLKKPAIGQTRITVSVDTRMRIEKVEKYG